MTRFVAAPLLLVFAACGAFAQAGAKLEFEVVSIKATAPPEVNGGVIGLRVFASGGPGSQDPGMWRCENFSLRNLITFAYSLNSFQLTGPDWLQEQRFDISAKVPEGTTREQFNIMMQNMLTERFQLTVHHEAKDMAKYDLVVAKNGPKLKETLETPAASVDASAGPQAAPKPMAIGKDGYPELAPNRAGMAIMNGHARMFYPKSTMEMLAARLQGQLGKPVTDATGLTGKYDIGLYWNASTMRASAPAAAPSGGGPAPMAAPDGDGGPTLEKAIQDQLGLRLEAKKGPVDILVVDHVEKLPTDN